MQTTPPHWQRNIAIFLLGQFLSGITSMTVQYAIIWYLTAKTGSAAILIRYVADDFAESFCRALY